MSSSAVARRCPSLASNGTLSATGARQPMDHVVGDAIALVLALAHLLGEGRTLGVVGEQVTQQQRRAQHVATGLLDQLQ